MNLKHLNGHLILQKLINFIIIIKLNLIKTFILLQILIQKIVKQMLYLSVLIININ